MAAVLSVLAGAGAQPYVAAGGFGAPVQVAGSAQPVAGVAADAGRTQVVWADRQGVWAGTLGGDDERLIAASVSVRGIWAAARSGDLAVAWSERDRTTGQTLHHLMFLGEDHVLFTSPQETPMQVGFGADGPWVVAPLRADGEARLTLFPWDGDGPGEPQVLYTTDLAVRGIHAAGVPGDSMTGPVWLAWLEGFSEVTAFGDQSEWHAFVMRPGTDELVDLGLADGNDQRQTVALGPVTGQPDSVMAMWPSAETGLRASLVRASPDGGLEVFDTAGSGEVGRPLAWVGDDVYWVDGPFVRRTAPFDPASEPISVAWSQELIGDAALAHDADTGLVSLAWHGRRQGGEVVVFASDDSVAFQPSLSDRVAALMSWSPWNLGQEATGQVLTAAIVGIMGTLAVAPLLFLFSLLLARIEAVRSRPLLAGAWLGVLVPPAIVVLVALRIPTLGLLEPGPLLGLVATLVFGALVGHLLTRGQDREAQLHVLTSSAATVLVGLTVWSFAYYRIWAPFVGL